MKFETLTWSPLWPLQRGSVSRLFDVTMTDAPLHVWKLFVRVRNCKFLTYADITLNNKRQPSMWRARPAHVDRMLVQALDSTTRPHCARTGTNILPLVATPVTSSTQCWPYVFSWNPYPQSCDTHRVPGNSNS